jgi:hypothetical protein
MSYINSHLTPSVDPSRQHAQDLHSGLSLQTQPISNGTHEQSPPSTANTTLNNEIVRLPIFVVPSKEDVIIAFDNCYRNISAKFINEPQITIVIDKIVDRVYDSPIVSEVEDIKEAVQQIIFLASRLVKGEACGECHLGSRVANPGSAELHLLFGYAIQNLVDVGTDLKLDWKLSVKATFAFDKLCKIIGGEYLSLEEFDIHRTPIHPQNLEGQEELEEMWCHQSYRGEGCHCWDGSYASFGDEWYMDRHYKHCPLGRY